ncbi:MAG: HAD-IA family hydrolase [Calditrichae bacterium]|nr:HAD-IA family hydrolase [Calditrichia bacterium]
MAKHPQYDLIIYDLDGTLVDTLGDLTASVNHVLASHQRPLLSIATVRELVGDGARKLLERSLETNDPEIVEKGLVMFGEHYLANVCVHSQMYETVAETLPKLTGKKQAIFTNKPVKYAFPLLEQLGIGQYFDAVIGGGMEIPLKPAPDGIVYLCQKLGVPPHRTVMVGDSATDILAGKSAGTATVAVTFGFRQAEQLRKFDPDVVIDRFDELLAIVE